jgi:hypothetical protein
VSFRTYLRRTALLVVAVLAAVTLLIGVGVVAELAAAQRSEVVPAELIEPEPGQSAAPVPSTSPSAEPAVGRAQAAQERAVRPAPTTARPPVADLPVTAAKPKTIRLSPVTALGSQKTIDKGKLVTWMTSPVCLLAGHNTMGWAWMDDLRNGTVVKVTTGPCRGTYKVYARKSQARKGGPVPAWMSDPKLDLVLQTCKTRGMGFSLLRRV